MRAAFATPYVRLAFLVGAPQPEQVCVTATLTDHRTRDDCVHTFELMPQRCPSASAWLALPLFFSPLFGRVRYPFRKWHRR